MSDAGVEAFSYERIVGKDGEVHFRVANAVDSRIATCYLEDNARFIVEQLKIAAHTEAAVKGKEAEIEVLDMRRGVLGNMLRYIAFVLAGDETADSQTAADRAKSHIDDLTARLAAAEGERDVERTRYVLASAGFKEMIRQNEELKAAVEQARQQFDVLKGCAAHVYPMDGCPRCLVRESAIDDAKRVLAALTSVPGGSQVSTPTALLSRPGEPVADITEGVARDTAELGRLRADEERLRISKGGP